MSSLAFLFKSLKAHYFNRTTSEKFAPCPVCKASAMHLDSVDFNKSCEEARGLVLPKSGTLVRYYLCDNCGFCFAPEICKWDFQEFERRIYNNEYEKIDPDYKLARPIGNAQMLDQLFGNEKISHLDYGGGSGLLSNTLKEKGWNSQSYDPYVDRSLHIESLGQFDLLTAFEVFEHVPDVNVLMSNLKKLLKPDGLILFSTLLSDGQIQREQPLRWWYASPRNGHISLFSMTSMQIFMGKNGFVFSSASLNSHIAYRQIPKWAAHLLTPK